MKLEIWFEGPVYYRLPKFGRIEAAGNRRTLEGTKQYSYFTITCDWYIQILQYEQRNCCTARYYLVGNKDEYFLVLYSSGCERHPGVLDYAEVDREAAIRILQTSKKEQPEHG